MKVTKSAYLWIAVVAILSSPLAPSAVADPAFQKEFWKKYLDPHANKEYETNIKKKVKCNLCHDPDQRTEAGKKSKKFRNRYGDELAKLLDRKADKKNLKKIKEALEKVGKMKSDMNDDKSPTFDELISQGKLPGAKPAGDKTAAK